MFGRRKDKQIPKTPVSQDKSVQNWMDSVGGLINKYFFGGGNDRIVTAQELIDGGIAGAGSGGFLTSPPKNLTKPPEVSGLTANGAFASIVVQWNNPSFSNYGYTELYGADVDDIGQRVLIASTAVESYTDNVGSAATKYYWARVVSDQGVKGDFNAVNGVKGTTSLAPEYVKQILTSITWKPNITYYPFQYVRPTVENGFQYAAVDGGKSGSVEPTWSTTINATVGDGTIQWTAVPVDERIPFVLGALEDGTPAVFMDTAYIKNASITSAKIGDLVADKITTGDLNADLHVLSKLWYGFNLPNGDFLDPENNTVTSGNTGFYLGVNGSASLPVLHLNTGVANGNRQFLFDGTQLTLKNVDLVSSADGEFDDLGVDSLTAIRAYALDLGFRNLFAVSEYVQLDAEGRPIIDDVDVRNYFCWIYGCAKKSIASPVYARIGSGNRGGIRLQTYANTGVVPYDYPDPNTKYRMKKKQIAFRIKFGLYPFGGINPHISALRFFIFEDTNGFSSNFSQISQGDAQSGYSGAYLAKLDLSFTDLNLSGDVYLPQTAYFKNSSNVNLFEVSYHYGGFANQYNGLDENGNPIYTQIPNQSELYIFCDSDNEKLNYSGNRRLKVGVEYELYVNASIDDDDNIDSQVYLQFILEDKPLELNAINDSFD